MSLSSALSAVDLSQMSLEEMAAEAYARARAVRGNVVTYSPKVFIPLTQLCRDRCGYCTFAQPPARLAAPDLSSDEVLAIARAGANVDLYNLKGFELGAGIDYGNRTGAGAYNGNWLDFVFTIRKGF